MQYKKKIIYIMFMNLRLKKKIWREKLMIMNMYISIHP